MTTGLPAPEPKVMTTSSVESAQRAVGDRPAQRVGAEGVRGEGRGGGAAVVEGSGAAGDDGPEAGAGGRSVGGEGGGSRSADELVGIAAEVVGAASNFTMTSSVESAQVPLEMVQRRL